MANDRELEKLFKDAEPLSTFLDPGETKKYRFKDFNPETVLGLLPGWEIKPYEVVPDKYSGWEFTRNLKNGDSARIVVDVDKKVVYLFLPTDKGIPTLSLKDVKNFELKPKLKELIFEGRSSIYVIKHSIWHYLESKDGKSRAAITTY